MRLIMNKPWHLSRRSALRGIGASLALPLLECMSDANGQLGKQTPQARMAFLYFPNGVAEGSWEPEQTGANGTLEKLSPWMKPLEKHKEHLLIPRNIWTPRGNGHMAGTATWLTGGEYSGREVSAGGMSVDQLAAKQVGQDTLLDSLQLSVRGEGFFSKSLPRNTISWLDRQTPASREIEPRIVFDQMFRTSDQFAPDSSVLDLILEDAKSLQQQLGAVDRDKLDQFVVIEVAFSRLEIEGRKKVYSLIGEARCGQDAPEAFQSSGLLPGFLFQFSDRTGFGRFSRVELSGRDLVDVAPGRISVLADQEDFVFGEEGDDRRGARVSYQVQSGSSAAGQLDFFRHHLQHCTFLFLAFRHTGTPSTAEALNRVPWAGFVKAG